jgi:hypothetical protein
VDQRERFAPQVRDDDTPPPSSTGTTVISTWST